MSVGSWRKKLKELILNRKTADDNIQQWTKIRDKYNEAILKSMAKHGKKEITLAGYTTAVVTPSSMHLKEKEILWWYKENGIKPPVKQVFDASRFEEDLKKKRVPTSLLRKYSVLERKKPYVRVAKVR